MNKLYKGNFIFIVGFSILFIMILSFGALSLTKKNSESFTSDGYILSSNKKYDFNSGTTYRLNLNKDIVFVSQDGKEASVELDSFVHYSNGDIGLLKTGAFVDLNGVTKSIVPFYNITSQSVINYSDGGYTIQNGDDKLYFKDILLRISEDKYLVAGKDLKVKIPGIEEHISGQYFEITYVADGIVLIENENNSYQVTADGSSIIVNDKLVIDLGTKNIISSEEVMLNMTQVTIDGNENISIVPYVESSDSSSSESSQNESSTSESTGNNSSSSSGGENGGSGESNEEVPPTPKDDEVMVELVSLDVGNKNLNAVFQVNNSDKIIGDLDVTITNTKTRESFTPNFSMTGTGYLSLYTDKLAINSDYILTIRGNSGTGSDITYFQRMFSTDGYGVSLEKIMVSDSDINYRVKFADSSSVESVTVTLTDKYGNVIGDTKSVSKSNNEFSYNNLDSNTTYTLKVGNFKIGNVTYADDSLTKKVMTLKKKPTVGIAGVDTNEDNTKFVLSIGDIEDPDSSITRYTYYVYDYSDLGGEPVYTATNTSSTLSLNVGTNGLSGDSNYRYKAIIEYNDNEKIREIETEYSSKFFSKGATVKFEINSDETSFDRIVGKLTMTDTDCNIPMPGRTACNYENSFRVVYNVDGITKYKEVTLEPTDEEGVYVIENLVLDGLHANTEYVFELDGNVIDHDQILQGVQIGKQFIASTKGTPTINVSSTDSLPSTDDAPVNTNVTITSNSTDSDFINKIKTIKTTLYAVDAADERHQIGNIHYLSTEEISAMYRREYAITNAFFGINNMDELVEVASDSTGWAYSNYVIVFSDAYDAEYNEYGENLGNSFKIENPEVKISIDKSYLLSYYARQKEDTTAKVTTIKNNQLDHKIEGLDGDIVVGYKIDATVLVDDILRQYYGVTGSNVNWNYLYYIYDEDGNQIYKTNNSKSTSHVFYLDDENIPNFDRGYVYQFGFQIFPETGIYYPNEPIIAVDSNGNNRFNPVKQRPNIALTAWENTDSTYTITYKIISDIDNALYGNNFYVYEKNDLVDTKTISKSDNYQQVTFENLDATKRNYLYKYNKANRANGNEYSISSIGGFVFDGKYTLNSKFTVDAPSVGNHLSIIVDDDLTLKRTAMYHVTISNNNNSKSYIFVTGTGNDYRRLTDCRGTGKKECMVIDYSDLEDFQGSNCTVKVEAYYDNGNTGLNVKSDYKLLKNSTEDGYLTVTKTGAATINNIYPNGIYTYTITDSSFNSIKNAIIKDTDTLGNTNAGINLNYSISNSGAVISGPISNLAGNNTSHNPKEVAYYNMKSDNNTFAFNSIIPSVQTTVTRKIDRVTMNIKVKGLTRTIANNEFARDDRNVTVELYKDQTYTNPVSVSDAIDIDNLDDTLTFEFDHLTPNTTYYYKVFANISSGNNTYTKTELYDYKASGELVIDTKSTSTLGKNEILKSTDAYYTISSGTTEYSKKDITIQSELLDTDNYKLVYSITNSNGETIHEKEITEISKDIEFTFDIDDTYVFGNSGNRITIKAITTDGLDNELELYNDNFVPHLNVDNSITELRKPILKVNNIDTDVKNGESSYTLSFNAEVVDRDFVIKNKKYFVNVQDALGNNISPDGHTLNESGNLEVGIPTGVSTTNLVYKGLSPDTYYFIHIFTETFMNNASLDDKNVQVAEDTIIKTGNVYNLKIGSGKLSVKDGNVVSIEYTGASNLDNINKIDITLRKNNQLFGAGRYTITGDDLDFSYSGDKWYLNMAFNNAGDTITNNDRVYAIVTYYANDLNGNSGIVATDVYANYND